MTITVNGTNLKQVKKYNYLESTSDEKVNSITEARKRVGMSKTAFWKCKELLRRDVNFGLKKRILDCYVKSVLCYGCETWTYNTAVKTKLNAFQMWCYRRMQKSNAATT